MYDLFINTIWNGAFYSDMAAFLIKNLQFVNEGEFDRHLFAQPETLRPWFCIPVLLNLTNFFFLIFTAVNPILLFLIFNNAHKVVQY